jgi:hypothetical protein
VTQDVARDHGDARVVGTLRVDRGVREVGQADLYDVVSVESIFEELSNRRSVGLTVAHVEMGVERDESEVGVVATGERVQRVPRGGVVTAEDEFQCHLGGEPRECLRNSLVAPRAVGVVHVAVVNDRHVLGNVDGVGERPRRIALE